MPTDHYLSLQQVVVVLSKSLIIDYHKKYNNKKVLKLGELPRCNPVAGNGQICWKNGTDRLTGAEMHKPSV